MKCPSCGHPKSIVADTAKGGSMVFRSRQCKACDHVWFTQEVVRDAPPPQGVYIRFRPRTVGEQPRPPRLPDEERIHRYRVRKDARKEAKETGEPVEKVYERWGVSTIRPTFRR